MWGPRIAEWWKSVGKGRTKINKELDSRELPSKRTVTITVDSILENISHPPEDDAYDDRSSNDCDANYESKAESISIPAPIAKTTTATIATAVTPAVLSTVKEDDCSPLQEVENMVKKENNAGGNDYILAPNKNIEPMDTCIPTQQATEPLSLDAKSISELYGSTDVKGLHKACTEVALAINRAIPPKRSTTPTITPSLLTLIQLEISLRSRLLQLILLQESPPSISRAKIHKRLAKLWFWLEIGCGDLDGQNSQDNKKHDLPSNSWKYGRKGLGLNDTDRYQIFCCQARWLEHHEHYQLAAQALQSAIQVLRQQHLQTAPNYLQNMNEWVAIHYRLASVSEQLQDYKQATESLLQATLTLSDLPYRLHYPADPRWKAVVWCRLGLLWLEMSKQQRLHADGGDGEDLEERAQIALTKAQAECMKCDDDENDTSTSRKFPKLAFLVHQALEKLQARAIVGGGNVSPTGAVLIQDHHDMEKNDVPAISGGAVHDMKEDAALPQFSLTLSPAVSSVPQTTNDEAGH